MGEIGYPAESALDDVLARIELAAGGSEVATRDSLAREFSKPIQEALQLSDRTAHAVIDELLRGQVAERASALLGRLCQELVVVEERTERPMRRNGL
jgi:hypothetical protein